MKDNQVLKLLKMSKVSKKSIALAIVFGVISSVATLVVPLMTRTLIDGTLSNFSMQSLLMLLGVFAIGAVFNGLTFFIVSYLGNKIVADLRKTLWDKIVYLPQKFFDNTLSGDTVSRIINDTNILKELVSEHAISFVTGTITLVVSVVILFIMDWQMTLIMLLAIPIAAAVLVPLGKLMFKISQKTQDQTAQFTSEISQSISEMKLVKASNAEDIEKDKTSKSVTKLFKYGVKEAKIFATLYPLMEGLVMIMVFGIVGYGGMRVASGTLTAGTLIAFVLYLFQIIMPITQFGTFFTQYNKAKGATTRILEILNSEVEDNDKGEVIDVTNKSIVFDKVSFAYEDKMILNEVSFEAKPNETIAFVGPSGGGKSTIFALIERFYQPLSGTINIGEYNVEEISLNSWRSQIGYVPQENSLFATSIRDNLTYGLDLEVSEERLWEVIELACATDFVSKLPDKLDTLIGERGLKLSGGQRQRIAIARAFLRNPRILLLDEATASLDSQSEQIVQQALENLMEGRTTLVIAHRLSTIVNANQIVFVEKGTITGSGKHQELLNNHSLYNEFATQQLTN
ncbi:MAG: ABC transporter ATP-binding protein [Erysipelotrichales bacterium]